MKNDNYFESARAHSKTKNIIKERVYISGKISGLGYSHVHLKFAASESALNHVGMEPVNPLKNGLPESATWKEHMRADIAMLKTCDSIYLQEDFARSRGAMIELFLAIRWGKPIRMNATLANDIAFISQYIAYPGNTTKYDILKFPTSHPVFLAAKTWKDHPLSYQIEEIQRSFIKGVQM